MSNIEKEIRFEVSKDQIKNLSKENKKNKNNV